jgi:hypothetical protein
VRLVPLTRDRARAFVREHHRHSRPDLSDIFRVGLLDEHGDLVAVGVAGRPKAQALDDGRTIEITRVCAQAGQPNACSRIYGALCRAGAALGYERAVTYTLQSEPGSSLLASGFCREADLPARSWARESGRDRYEENLLGEAMVPPEPKVRWARALR